MGTDNGQTTRSNLFRWSGIVAALLALGGVVLATLVSPAFQWRENALSNLGVTTTAAGTPLTVLLFNGGLVAGGALGLAFAAWLWRSGKWIGDRVVAVLFGLALVAMAGIGLFPQGTPLHFPVAAAFYLFVTVLLWADGVVAAVSGRRQRGVGAAVLGATELGAWIAWSVTGPFLRPGLALPEGVGAVGLATWVVGVALAGR